MNPRPPLLAQLLILLSFGTILIFASTYYNEITPANKGLGFDGKHYAELAMDFPDAITKAPDTKYFQRSFPSFVVYSITRLFHLEASPNTAIFLFSVYNLLLLLLCVYGWNKICRVSGFNTASNWLGFGALFLNFASLKFPFFYPVLTDITGFTLSVFLVYFFKVRNKTAMLFIMVLSALSWPSIEYMCLALLLFQNKEIVFSEQRKLLPSIIAFLLALGFATLAGYLIYRHPQMRGGWAEHTWIIKNMIIPTLIATFVVIFLALQNLLRGLDLFSIPVFKIIDVKFGLISIVLFLGVDIAIKNLAKHYGIPSGYSIRMYLNDILIIGSRQPFCFLVGHAAYFGPLFTVCIFKWRQICTLVHRYGWALFFIMLQFVFFMLDSETRHILNYMPFIALLLVETFDNKIQRNFLIAGLVVSFLFSKAWISLLHFPTDSPTENYNLNFGCYLSDAAYLIQLFIFTLICIAFYVMLKPRQIR
ncbi:MAG: hypothetical protein ACXVP0_14610 [Bacteroidia bacterium]